VSSTVPEPATPSEPTRAPRRNRWWYVAAGLAGLSALIGATALTATVVDEGDSDGAAEAPVNAVFRDAATTAPPLDDTVGDGTDAFDDADDADDDADDVREDRALAAAATVSAERAASIARDAAGGGTVTEVDLDDEAGRVVYEVEVRLDAADPRREVDVVLDARTGDVLATTPDDED
jgi:uncharacterized membrane protein YkoI